MGISFSRSTVPRAASFGLTDPHTGILNLIGFPFRPARCHKPCTLAILGHFHPSRLRTSGINTRFNGPIYPPLFLTRTLVSSPLANLHLSEIAYHILTMN